MTTTNDLNGSGSGIPPISFSLSLDDDVDIDAAGPVTQIQPHSSVIPSSPSPTPVQAHPPLPTHAPAPTPTPASPPANDLTDAQIGALANEVVAALAEHDGAAGADPSIAASARQLLTELNTLRSSVGVSDAERTAVWTRVSAARQAYADALAGPAAPTNTVSPETLATAEQLNAELGDAEQRARRPMSGPGAFKKFASARRAFELFLADNSVSSLDELSERVAGTADTSNRQAVAEELAAAEQAWQQIERQAAITGLPDTPAADAFRIRVYRLVGRVVDDPEIESELHRLATAVATDPSAALERMAFAMNALGIPTDRDIVSTARTIAAQMRGR